MNGFTIPSTNGYTAVPLPERDGTPNGYANGETSYDLICVGFGPASLAIAIALSERTDLDGPKKVLFLERQSEFAWHSGMLLPGSRMQISFLKDMATMRNPTSKFTFINYLHQKGRLANFMNLGTFLPLREEYNDYMAWCASHFKSQVRYNHNVVSILPLRSGTNEPVNAWEVSTQHEHTGEVTHFKARNIVIAIGGKPSFPRGISPNMSPRIIHSSAYIKAIGKVCHDPGERYNIAVVGAGQSAAEIFRDLHSRYPRAKTSLFIRAHALKPSDDSPFVNEIFDPDRVDHIFSLPEAARAKRLAEDKATNYSVVRLELLEELYTDMYRQKIHQPDETRWQHRIFPLHETVSLTPTSDKRVVLHFNDTMTGRAIPPDTHAPFDCVIFATGYERNVHETLLKPAQPLMKGGVCTVGRDYRVMFEDGAVSPRAGVFLQGCCEKTHGLSDSLLSILAVRAGEIAESVFGPEMRARGVDGCTNGGGANGVAEALGASG